MLDYFTVYVKLQMHEKGYLIVVSYLSRKLNTKKKQL